MAENGNAGSFEIKFDGLNRVATDTKLGTAVVNVQRLAAFLDEVCSLRRTNSSEQLDSSIAVFALFLLLMPLLTFFVGFVLFYPLLFTSRLFANIYAEAQKPEF
jgi:hypothetical protein